MKNLIKPLLTAAAFLLICLIVLQGTQPVKYDISVDASSPVDIYAPRNVVDKLSTEKQKNLAAERVQSQYTLDNEVTVQATRNLADIFNEINRIRDEVRAGGDLALLLESFKYSVDKNVVVYCVMLSEDTYQDFRTKVTEIQKELMNQGVINTAEALMSARELMGEDEQATANGVAMLAGTISVNSEQNDEATEAERQRVMDAVPSVSYKVNQIIVRRGDIVTKEQYAVLSDLGLVRGDARVPAAQVTGVVFFVLLSFFAVYMYLNTFNRKVLKTTGLLAMLLLIVTLNLCMVFLGRYTLINLYAIPIFVGTILIAILTDARLSLVVNALTVIFAGFALKVDAYWIGVLLIAGSIGAFAYTRAIMRRGLVYAALIHTVINALLYISSGLVEGIDIYESLTRGMFGAISTVAASVLVIGTLPFWEQAFDVITPYKLLELSNPNHPLLKKLLVDAPGTYHHSLMVGNLAEAACEQIGANPLLARVGAYYHDIGKIARASLFKENQYAENPHDKMSPELSAWVIISHVKDGIEAAKKYRLPDAIKKIIETHHGNSQLVYFYHKAKNADGVVENKEKYYYSHPLPKTKEQAVVMLADSSEAAVRALEEKSEAHVLETIRKIVNGKLVSGQLDNSELTLKDINEIIKAFSKVFGGYFHSRIKYPEDKKSE